MSLPQDLVALPAEEAARRILLELLERAARAADRLVDETDDEALHDFRVAIRRLRSGLRAWRGILRGGASKRQRRALRRLQEATSGARDAEVALNWLERQRGELAPEDLPGCDGLCERLARRRERELQPVHRKLRRDFAAVRKPLRRRLRRMTVRLDPRGGGAGGSTRFAAALAVRIREGAAVVERRLDAVKGTEDRIACHRARIADKRLRYLLEPLRGVVPESRPVVRLCQRLQDVLGDLNDAHVLRAEIGSETERLRSLATAPDPDDAMAGRSVGPAAVELAGLSALRDRVEVRIGGLFAELRTDWLGDGSGRFTLELEALAARLEHDARADDAIERVFLLRGLPDLPAHAEVLDVDLGWLPGERLRERIRRQSGDTGTAYFRTLEFSEGLRRTEIEEPTSAEVFESLWRLTKDCRIRKRRYQVREGGLVFAIDEFLDRELFLAEVELPDAAAQPRLPGWLAARVAREVTDDSRYTNFELARGGERSPSDG